MREIGSRGGGGAVDAHIHVNMIINSMLKYTLE